MLKLDDRAFRAAALRIRSEGRVAVEQVLAEPRTDRRVFAALEAAERTWGSDWRGERVALQRLPGHMLPDAGR